MEDPDKKSDRGYRTLEHTADIMFEVWAPSMASLFETAAHALVDHSVEVPEGFAGGDEHFAEFEGDNEMLMVQLLEEVIYLIDTGYLPLSPIAAFEEGKLTCRWRVYPLTEKKSASPKAATYHQLLVEEKSDGSFCRFIIDI